MPTANELYRDAVLRHQIGLRRYSAGLINRITRLLEQADAELTVLLRNRLAAFEGKPIDFTGARWQALLADISAARATTMIAYREAADNDFRTLSQIEAQKELDLLTAAVPVEFSWATVSLTQLKAITDSRPFQGHLLKDWYSGLEVQDQQRLRAAIQMGMAQGEGVDQIVRRVIGTKVAGYTDGALSITRRDANTIVRTAVNHISNTARSYVWEENNDIIQAMIWSSVLDGRTSPSCQARDGHGTPVNGNELPPGVPRLTPAGVRPPGHMNCRAVMVAYIDGVGLIGNRPTVTDTRTRKDREVDFRAEAKRTGQSVKDVRSVWARENIGGVPAATTYQEFLSRQSATFQDEVLGPTRGKLFRQGGLKVDQFVDRAGNELTLKQLAATNPQAFIRAGIDPGP